jgi:hypothetical protein
LYPSSYGKITIGKKIIQLGIWHPDPRILPIEIVGIPKNAIPIGSQRYIIGYPVEIISTEISGISI